MATSFSTVNLSSYEKKTPQGVGSHYGVEPSPANGDSPSGLPYENTFRFLPPTHQKVLIHVGQSAGAEFWFTLFFVLFVASSIAGGADIQSKCFIVGLAYAGLSFIFWNFGRPQGNPAVTIALALTGHINAWTTCANLVGQCAGAFAAVGIQWGFFNLPGSDLPPVVTPVLTLGVLWGWSIWWSFVLILMILMGMSDRLFGELLDVEKNGMSKKHDGHYAAEFMGTSRDIPIGLQLGIYSHMNAKTAVAGGVGYFITHLCGYLFMGSPNYNFWFWLSGALAPAVASPPTGTMSIGNQFALYAFGSIVGGIGAAAVVCFLIWWSRKMHQWYMRGADGCEKPDMASWWPARY